jgi:hypothetical protein
MSQTDLVIAVIMSILMILAVPFIIMSYRRNEPGKHIALAQILLFLGLGSNSWRPLFNLSETGEIVLTLIEMVLFVAYLGIILKTFIGAQRSYHLTGKLPAIWGGKGE